MDHIDSTLAMATQDRTYSSAIRAALAIGKQTLNKYYNKTDCSEVYRIAMGMSAYPFKDTYLYYYSVLHPRHKLQYFETAGWEDDWIKTARSIVRDEFDRMYAFMDINNPKDGNILQQVSDYFNLFFIVIF